MGTVHGILHLFLHAEVTGWEISCDLIVTEHGAQGVICKIPDSDITGTIYKDQMSNLGKRQNYYILHTLFVSFLVGGRGKANS
jgi:hypothetical protein